MEKPKEISFKKLKCFPDIEEDRIPLVPFLDASNEITKIIESFGKLFTPVVSDMYGNIEKLRKCYSKDSKTFVCLENLLDKKINKDIDMVSYAAEALLWLKRALYLIWIFFDNILNDEKLSENLKDHLQDAYNKTLKPHHGWVIQSTISFIYRWVPKRSDFFGVGVHQDENITIIKNILPTMKLNLVRIDNLLKDFNHN